MPAIRLALSMHLFLKCPDLNHLCMAQSQFVMVFKVWPRLTTVLKNQNHCLVEVWVQWWIHCVACLPSLGLSLPILPKQRPSGLLGEESNKVKLQQIWQNFLAETFHFCRSSLGSPKLWRPGEMRLDWILDAANCRGREARVEGRHREVFEFLIVSWVGWGWLCVLLS